MIKTCMITVREGDHYLTGLLRDFIVRYGVLFQYLRGDQRHFVTQERLTRLIRAGKETVGQPFETASVLRRDRVPRFGGTEM